MYSYANFEISLSASDSDKAKIEEFLETHLDDQLDVFHVEEWSATSFDIENLAIALAQFILQTSCAVSFNMDGCIVNNYTTSDFTITYANGTLTIRSNEDNEYDVCMIQDSCPDYETFCYRFWNADKHCPMYTEEEYQEFCTYDPVFVTDDGRILLDAPDMGASKTFHITPDSVFLQSSGEDRDDDNLDEDDD